MMLRPATAGDLDAICAIDHLSADPGRRSFIQKALAADHATVAVLDERVIGYLVLDYSFYAQGFIALLYVDDAHRRAGVGTRLMRHAEAQCKTPRLFTSTNESNAPMHALLEGLGFARSGEIHNLDEGDPEIVYFKRCGAYE
jgi:GNAT superfamily N-acetyltransferase